jgi:hypothetical protein
MNAISKASDFLVHPPNDAAVNLVRILTLDGSPGALSALVQLRMIREVMISIWRQKRQQSDRSVTPPTSVIDNMRPAEYFVSSGAIALLVLWFLIHHVSY